MSLTKLRLQQFDKRTGPIKDDAVFSELSCQPLQDKGGGTMREAGPWLQEGSAAGVRKVIEPRTALLVESGDWTCMTGLEILLEDWAPRALWPISGVTGSERRWEEGVLDSPKKKKKKPDGEPVAVETAVQVEGVIPPPGCCQHSGPSSWRLFKDLLEKRQSRKQQHSSATALY